VPAAGAGEGSGQLHEDVEAPAVDRAGAAVPQGPHPRLQAAELKRADQLSSMKEEILEAFNVAVKKVQEDTLKKLEDRETLAAPWLSTR
jgi:hypothetical protein